jgi:hypothetical protein
MGSTVATFRTDVLQLPAIATGDRLKMLGAVPNIYAVGEALLPTPSDWPHTAVTTGFFFLEEAMSAARGDDSAGNCIACDDSPTAGSNGTGTQDKAGSAELLQLREWISTHPRPVVVNFGSMACLDDDNVNVPENSVKAALQLGVLSSRLWHHVDCDPYIHLVFGQTLIAFALTTHSSIPLRRYLLLLRIVISHLPGCAVVMVTGWGCTDTTCQWAKEDRVFVCKSAPHEWLFPLVTEPFFLFLVLPRYAQ